MEINNKFNLVSPTEAPKGSKEEGGKVPTPGFCFKDEDSQEEEEITEYSHHNIHGESIINSKGNLIPFRKSQIQLTKLRMPNWQKEKRKNHLIISQK